MFLHPRSELEARIITRRHDGPPPWAVIPDPGVRPCVSADEAFAELGIDRTTGYRAIREGKFPVPIIRVGRLIKVPTAPLRRLLAIDDTEAPDVASAPSEETVA